MEIVVINLERDIFKKTRASAILNNLDLIHSFFKAIDGKNLKKEIVDNVKKSGTNLFNIRTSYMSESEIGLYLSHIEIMKTFLNTKNEYICVLEDDFILKKGFKSLIDKIDCDKALNFDVLMLGHFMSNKDYGVICKFSLLQQKIVKPLEFNYGTHAYVINKRAAETIVNNFSVPLCPIDHILGLCEVYGLNRMVCSPPIVFQDDAFESTVQTKKFNSKTDPFFLLKRILKYLLYNFSPRIAMKHLLRHKII